MATEFATHNWNGGNKQKHRRPHTADRSILKLKELKEVKDIVYEAAHISALRARLKELESRLQALEKHARDEKIKQNKFVLRELVKEARTRILEVNGVPLPPFKQSWKYCLSNLSAQQLQQANVNLRLWPDIIEILSPSAMKLNGWVHGYNAWQAARVIDGMESHVQSTWAELFKLIHNGERFEKYIKQEEPSMADKICDVG